MHNFDWDLVVGAEIIPIRLIPDDEDDSDNDDDRMMPTNLSDNLSRWFCEQGKDARERLPINLNKNQNF